MGILKAGGPGRTPGGHSGQFPPTDFGPLRKSSPLPTPPGPLKLRLLREKCMNVPTPCASRRVRTCRRSPPLHYVLHPPPLYRSLVTPPRAALQSHRPLSQLLNHFFRCEISHGFVMHFWSDCFERHSKSMIFGQLQKRSQI